MKFNETTLKKTIEDLKLDIIQNEQDLLAIKTQKSEL